LQHHSNTFSSSVKTKPVLDLILVPVSSFRPVKYLNNMHIDKNINYSNILPLSELKADLNIVANDTSYDAQLNRFLKAATQHIYNQIQADILPTQNVLEDYCFYGSYYTINEGKVAISSVTITNNITTNPVTSVISGYTLQKGEQYTTIRFFNWVSAEKISIVYSSGSDEIPFAIQRAISMQTAQYFDVDRSGYVANVNETKAIERLIAPYRNILY
jgi:Tfp pilus assembly protein PilW